MRKIKKQTKLQGFSIFEILVTLGIILMLSAIVFPLTIQKLQATKLKSHASQLASDIYFQQQEGFYKSSPKGISLGGNSYTIFDGETLATATETSTESFPTNVTITPVDFVDGTEFYFPEGEFKPSSSGYLTLTDGFNSITIYINREGLIYYD